MEPKTKMDGFGAGTLIFFALILAFNQVVIKVTNDGLQPVFFAGIRSLGGAILVLIWVRLSGRKIEFKPGTTRAAILLGSFFSLEFLLLFLALDHTSVVRMSIILYSMPVWLAIAAHFFCRAKGSDRAKPLGWRWPLQGSRWQSAVAPDQQVQTPA